MPTSRGWLCLLCGLCQPRVRDTCCGCLGQVLSLDMPFVGEAYPGQVLLSVLEGAHDVGVVLCDGES